MRKRFMDAMVAAAGRLASDPEALAETHAVQEEFSTADAEALEIAKGPDTTDAEPGCSAEMGSSAAS